MDYIQKGVVLPKPPSGVHAVEHLASSFTCAVGRFFNNNVFRKRTTLNNAFNKIRTKRRSPWYIVAVAEGGRYGRQHPSLERSNNRALSSSSPQPQARGRFARLLLSPSPPPVLLPSSHPLDDSSAMGGAAAAAGAARWIQRLSAARISTEALERGQSRVIDASLTLIRERAKLKVALPSPFFSRFSAPRLLQPPWRRIDFLCIFHSIRRDSNCTRATE
ncbi:hypothetical protein CFC21_027301 [Triticum aestivum]|uniref:Uncharacterized protein n=2 Tax=Triticum aestivum TaxID=4565 RepID=A0A9R1EN07_WHEAT|nr:hypothetical protein CFC21_027301 [Triticum aestivum]